MRVGVCICACVCVCAVRTWVCPAQGYCDSVTQAFLHMLVDLRMCGFCGRLSPVSPPFKALAKRNVFFPGYGCSCTDSNDIGLQDEAYQSACIRQPRLANKQIIHLANHRDQVPPAPAHHSHLTYRLSNISKSLRLLHLADFWLTISRGGAHFADVFGRNRRVLPCKRDASVRTCEWESRVTQECVTVPASHSAPETAANKHSSTAVSELSLRPLPL